jgi:hypothetical protein
VRAHGVTSEAPWNGSLLLHENATDGCVKTLLLAAE